MKTITKELGKVSITCNGKWDISRTYERLCLVHDGMFASYISKKEVPNGTNLENEEYWQPVANLKEDVKVDYSDFKANMLELLAEIQRKLGSARIVVKDMAERDSLTALEAGVGCEVYVLETKQTWILDKIVCIPGGETCVKEWHLEADSKIDSEEKYELEGTFDTLTADRAICDAYGNIIHDTYVTREAIHEYVDDVIDDFLNNWKYEIKPGSITYDMLSEGLKQLFADNVDIVNMPDEEDITVVANQLKFKDRPYDELQFSGMGYKILRKNWMGEINLLEQSMINEPNTIYIIRYLFCLDNQEITIPENCVLVFCGGSFNKGTVNVNQARIRGVHKLSQMGTASFTGEFSDGQLMFIEELNEECVWKDHKWQYLPHADRIPNPYQLKIDEYTPYDGTEEVVINLGTTYATKTELSEVSGSVNNFNNTLENLKQEIIENVQKEIQSITESDITIEGNDGEGNAIVGLTASGHTITVTKGTISGGGGDEKSITVTETGEGNAITKIEANGHALTVTKSQIDGGGSGGNISLETTGEGNAVTDVTLEGSKLTVKKGNVGGTDGDYQDLTIKQGENSYTVHSNKTGTITIPETTTKLQALTFTGNTQNTSKSYDGSAPVSIYIPTDPGDPPDMSDYYTKSEVDSKFATKEEFNSLKQTVEGLQANITTYEQKFESIEQKITKIEEQITNLTPTLATLTFSNVLGDPSTDLVNPVEYNGKDGATITARTLHALHVKDYNQLTQVQVVSSLPVEQETNVLYLVFES